MNIYLEKIASTALSRHIATNGTDAEKALLKTPYQGSRQLNEAFTGKTNFHTISAGGDKTSLQKNIHIGFGKKQRVYGGFTARSGATTTTTDVLAGRGSPQQRLADQKALLKKNGPAPMLDRGMGPTPRLMDPTVRAPKAAPGGLLQKALGFAKKNPLLAGGAAVLGGLGAMKMMNPSGGQSQQQYYQQGY